MVSIDVSVIVKLLVHPPDVAAWFIYIRKNLRAYPGTLRGTAEWDSTYKIRTTVERSINHFKDCFGLANRKTQNEKTLHADLILAGFIGRDGSLKQQKFKLLTW